MRSQRQAFRARRTRRPLDSPTIRALALHYVGRYATTRARLQHYLERKIREHGLAEGASGPDIASLVEEFASLGYVDDEGFARARAESLLRRGYGARRVNAALRHAGIDESVARAAFETDSETARMAAWAFARRRKLGPFGDQNPDENSRFRAISAFLRAGYDYRLAREIVDSESPDTAPDEHFG